MQLRNFWRFLSTGLLVLTLLSLLLPAPAMTRGPILPGKALPQAYALCQVSTPSGGEVSVLNAVADVPIYQDRPLPTTMWAVGYTTRQAVLGPAIATLTMRYDGRAWQIVPSPNVADQNVLTGVAAYSANDVWAVGYAGNGTRTIRLILHFNGYDWTVWREPTLVSAGMMPENSRLTGVTIITTPSPSPTGPQPALNEAVAVGYTETRNGPMPIVLHYDGKTWTNMALPPSMMFSRLYAVTGKALDDLWAVGTIQEPEAQEAAYLFHHTAAGWMPIVKGWGTLTGLAIHGDRIFTVGQIKTFSGAQTLVMAYTVGTGDWVQIKSFNTEVAHNVLTGIVGNGSKLYAVGYAGKAGDNALRTPLVLVYTGEEFAPVSTPPLAGVSELHGAVVSNGVFWAVGTTGHEMQRSTLVLTNNCWTLQ